MATNRGQGRILENPRWVTMLFSSTEYAWVWLFVRIYLGIQWLNSGWHKLFEEAWWGNGAAVKSFWERIVVVPADAVPPSPMTGTGGSFSSCWMPGGTRGSQSS